MRLLLPESRKTNTDGLSSQWTVACRGVEDGLKNHEKQQQTIDSPRWTEMTHTFGARRRRRKQRALLARETGTKSPTQPLHPIHFSRASRPDWVPLLWTVWKREGEGFSRTGLHRVSRHGGVTSVSNFRGGEVGRHGCFDPITWVPQPAAVALLVKSAHLCQLRLATGRGREGW